jgi:hypothetical protein
VTVLGFDLGSKKNVRLPWSGTVNLDGTFNNAGNLYLGSTSYAGGLLKGAGTFLSGTTNAEYALALEAPTTGITGTAFTDAATALVPDMAVLKGLPTGFSITGTNTGGGAIVWAASSGGFIGVNLSGTSAFEPAATLIGTGTLGSTITDLELTISGTSLLISGTASGTIITGSSNLIDFGTSALKSGGVITKPFKISGTVETD